MTRDEMVDLITQRLGNRTDLRPSIISELRLLQIKLERSATLPWFLLSEMTTGHTTADEERLRIPDDFIRGHEENESVLWIQAEDAGEWVPVEFYDSYVEMVAEYNGADTGRPMKGSLIGPYVRLRPIPDDEYAVRWFYYAKQTAFGTEYGTADTENAWSINVPDLLVAEAGYVICTAHTQMPDAAALFQTERLEARQRLVMEDVARREAMVMRSMGGKN